MSDKGLGFGIIGSGFIAGLHAEAIASIDGAYLAAVYDAKEELALAFAKKHQAYAVKSVEQLLSDDNVDIVCICTPSGLHKEYAVAATEAGKHIVVEKPLALSVTECDEIIDACERNNVKATVISQLRYSQGFRQLKYAIENGWLGTLTSGSISMKYYRSPEYYGNSWRGTIKMDGGGALMNQGIHGVDLLQCAMGKVSSVYGLSKTLVHNIEVEDTLCATLEYENGAIGVIEATTSSYPGFNRRMEICGSKGSIVLVEDEITFFEFADKSITLENLQSGTGKYSANDNTNISAQGHIRQLADFVNAINNDLPVSIDCREGKKAVEIITAVYQSSLDKRVVFL